jgi:hypothetical protein
MKILLIQPPVRDFYQTAIRTQPIGLAYLAAALEQAGCDVEILDCQVTNQKKSIPVPERFSGITEFYPRGDLSPFRLYSGYHHFGLSYEEIKELINKSSADVVGISSQFTPYCDEAFTIASLAKAINVTTPVIMGGAHVSAAPAEVLRHPAVDYVITGEGEAALPLLIDYIKQGRQPHAFGGELVNARRGCAPENAAAVAAEFAVAEIVGQDEDDVGLACPEPCRGVRRKCRAGDECQSGNNYSKRNSDC